jgi:hypothetical protein
MRSLTPEIRSPRQVADLLKPDPEKPGWLTAADMLATRGHRDICLLNQISDSVRANLEKNLSLARILVAVSTIFCPHTILSAPRFVQGNYAVAQGPSAVVTVPYARAQAAQDLNVVVVGWNDTTARVTSVTDTRGNIYQLAIGPTQISGAASQAIYYAPGIAAANAGANSVTITFSMPAADPDVRILDYSGIDPITPIDGATGATGISRYSNSGILATQNAWDILVAGNYVETGTNAAGRGFAIRVITPTGADICEDRVVTAAGQYNAGAGLRSAGWWVMQVVAFRAEESSEGEGTVTLAWNADAATTNSGTNPVGYKLYVGFASRSYNQTTDVGDATSVTFSQLTSGDTYYFAVTAYNAAGIESPYSNEVSYTAP